MPLLTDDCDLNEYILDVQCLGDDYYISIKTPQERVAERYVRVVMSGGCANTRVKLAIAELYQALEEYNQIDAKSIKRV